jgi:hypothetical protein
MMKYGENRRQNPRLILNTIQPANYIPQSVTIRHTYDNTCHIKNLIFSPSSQENYHINFLPNSLVVFNNGGSLKDNANVTYGRDVIDTFNNNDSVHTGTTVLDDTLYQAGWAKRYKKAQVMATHYNFNIRNLESSSYNENPETDKLQPILISLIRSHQSGVINNGTSTEELMKLPFTQTRFLGKGKNQNNGTVNIKVAHYPSRFNGQQKNYVNNPEYCMTTGASIAGTAGRMLSPEKDFLTLALSLPSSALFEDGGFQPMTNSLLIRMRISCVVRYCEPAIGYNEPIPNTNTVIQSSEV